MMLRKPISAVGVPEFGAGVGVVSCGSSDTVRGWGTSGEEVDSEAPAVAFTASFGASISRSSTGIDSSYKISG